MSMRPTAGWTLTLNAGCAKANEKKKPSIARPAPGPLSLSTKRHSLKESWAVESDPFPTVYLFVSLWEARKRFLYCAWGALGEERERERAREREREREVQRETDGSDVTIVALKLAISLHFLLPKIITIGDEFTLSLSKNSHFSFLPSWSHFPSLPS